MIQFNAEFVISQDHVGDWHVFYEGKAHNSVIIVRGNISGLNQANTIKSAIAHCEGAISHHANSLLRSTGSTEEDIS